MMLFAQQVASSTEMDGRYVLYGLLFGFTVVGVYKILEALATAILDPNEVDSDDRHG